MRTIFLTFISFFFISSSYSSELNLYTSRHYPSDLILFKKFEEKTGIKVNVINAKSKVLEKRLLDEGPRSKGDVLFLADAGALYSAEKKKLFAKYNQSKSLKLVPMSLKNKSTGDSFIFLLSFMYKYLKKIKITKGMLATKSLFISSITYNE